MVYSLPMHILNLIYALFIGPLELFFEVVYAVAYRFIGDPGVSIVVLSLAMNFLVLPLYRRADAMQENERARSMKMKPGADHIKKTFKGDERFMMLQTFNRQNGYKPTDALKGSVSLLLEIPFFIAAYHFLSNLELLRGVSFGPIADLGAPDALLQLGDVTINVLPILMTAINLISAIIYMKGLPIQNKIQMYGIAAIFLILLYNSPSGLVFYWTLNNVFSLVKNVFYKLKNPRFILSILSSVVGAIVLLTSIFAYSAPSMTRLAFLIAMGLILQLPLVLHFFRPKRNKPSRIPDATPEDARLFFLCALFLAILTGALIPLAVIQASPAEFVNPNVFESPLWYCAYSLMIALGTFVIWFGVFYWLATPRGKTVFGMALFAIAGIAVVNYLLFGLDLGNLSPKLQFENVPSPTISQASINLAVSAGILLAFAALWNWKKPIAKALCVSMCIAVAVMAGYSAIGINSNLEPVKKAIAAAAENGEPHTTISKNGKNVVVIMLDRSISSYLPYMLYEQPELKERLRGFTYYPNAVSFGAFTNVGTPGLYGGYDYTPESMNARSDLSIGEKHDEALRIMPTIFSQNGYNVTFFDPTYAAYDWIPNLSLFDDISNMNEYITMDGSFLPTEYNSEATVPTGLDPSTLRNFFCYSLFKVAPLVLQPYLYNGGDYNSTGMLAITDESSLDSSMFGTQTRDGASRSRGIDYKFMASYSVLQRLPEITYISDDDRNTFFIMSNDTAHEPTVLAAPQYAPALVVDNTEFDKEHEIRYAEDGSSLSFPEESGATETSRIMHYEINMAAFQELCNWFDYLRENDAYDNTRIIIVSDHGRDLELYPDLVFETSDGPYGEPIKLDTLMLDCMLLVKDFDSQEFTTDTQFMTNADTPTLAFKDLVDNPVNPFTGNPINSNPKNNGEQHLLFSYDWSIDENNGNVFLPGYWLSVSGDVHDRNSWTYLGYY